MPARISADLAGLARIYFAIAIWRRGPQDLPAVGILLPLTVAAYVLLMAALGAALPVMPAGWRWQLALDVLFMLAWYWVLLAIAGRRERYVQTAAALFGLQTVLAAPTMLLGWLMQRVGTDDSLRLPLQFAALALSIWELVAVGHIVRSAIERALGLCLMLALLQMLVEALLVIGLFGPVR